jgi:Protein of unknown function, DUF547
MQGRRAVLRLPALGLFGLLGGFTFLERLALPRAELIDPFWKEHAPGSTERVDHDAWDRLLKTYVSTDAAGVNRVAYGRVSAADRAALGAYLERLAAVPVEQLDRPEHLAFWVNLYNARTVVLVLEHYPVTSIRDIRFGLFDIGPWSEPLLEVRGRKLSLNDIEHGILRPIWLPAELRRSRLPEPRRKRVPRGDDRAAHGGCGARLHQRPARRVFRSRRPADRL